MSEPTYSERAEQYARDVVAGEILAAKPTRIACERHLLDLEKESDEGFAYRYDPEKADRVCRFVEQMPHTKGRWADRGELLKLEDWQVFITCVVFGWVQKRDGFRRFRRVYIECPRKNGKSPYTAAVALYMFAADEEYGAEVYSGAGSEKQAWEVFKPAKIMARERPDFREAFGVEVNARNLNILSDFSKFEPVIGKPGDGASPSMAIHDEFHEHDTDEQYDTMRTGMVGREQPLSWIITTAGSDTSGPCYAIRNEVMDMLEGTVTNDRLFGIVWTIDEDDDWTTEDALRKANPNFGISIEADELLSAQREAVNYARKQSSFKMKHLNIWTNAASPYFNLEKWNRLADESLSIDDFQGEACCGGLDLASKLDLTADVKVFKREIDNETHYYTFLRAYIPRARIEDPEKRHYFGWAQDGHLIATPGNITDYDEVESNLVSDSERFRYVELGIDPYNATQISKHLVDKGLDVIDVPQTVANLSEPMKWVQALIEDGRIHHDGNPVFAWAIGNVTAQEDRNANVFPRKERAENKIDPAVALIIAIGSWMRSESAGSSVYEERGVLVL